MAKLTSLLGGLGDVLSKSMAVLTASLNAPRKAADNLAAAMKKSAEEAEKAAKEAKKAAAAHAKLAKEAAKSGGKGATSGGKSPAAKAPSGGSSGSMLGKAASVGGALAAVAGPIAAIGVAAAAAAAALAALPSVLKPFVEAIDPGAIELHDRAMRELTATIGQAFVPVFKTLTSVIEYAADSLAPSLERLRPLIEKASVAIGGTLAEAAKTLGAVLQLLVPIFEGWLPNLEYVADQLSGVIALTRAAAAVTVGLLETIVSAMGINLKVLTSAMDFLRDSVYKVTRAMILLAARMLKFFGMDTALKRLKEAFDPTKRGARATPAPQDFGFSGIGDILKQNVLDAQMAGGAGKDSIDYLPDIYKEIGEIMASGSSIDAEVKVIRTVVADTVRVVMWEIARYVIKELPLSILKALASAPASAGRSAFRLLGL